MNDKIGVDVTQFLRPAGRERSIHTLLNKEVMDLYCQMKKAGCCFESEVLSSGEVSVSISNGEEDLAIEIVENGPDVQLAMEDLLRTKCWERVRKEL